MLENVKLNANKNLKYPNKGGKVNKHKWKETGGAINAIEIHPSIHSSITCFNRIRLFQISLYLSTISIFSSGILMHSWANGIYMLLSLLDIPWRPQTEGISIMCLADVGWPCLTEAAVLHRAPSRYQITFPLRLSPAGRNSFGHLFVGLFFFFFIFSPPPRV